MSIIKDELFGRIQVQFFGGIIMDHDIFILRSNSELFEKEYKIIVIMLTINVVNVDIYVLD